MFASAAAVGAGLAVNVDVVTHHAYVGEVVGAAAFTVPVATFVLTVWWLQRRLHKVGGWSAAAVPVAAAAVLAATFTPQPVLLSGLVLAVTIAVELARAPGAARVS